MYGVLLVVHMYNESMKQRCGTNVLLQSTTYVGYYVLGMYVCNNEKGWTNKSISSCSTIRDMTCR